MTIQVKRVGLIKHQIICDNIFEYMSLWGVLLTFSALVSMGIVALVKLAAA